MLSLYAALCDITYHIFPSACGKPARKETDSTSEMCLEAHVTQGN